MDGKNAALYEELPLSILVRKYENMIGTNHSEILLHIPDPYISLTGVPELRSTKVRLWSTVFLFTLYCKYKVEFSSHGKLQHLDIYFQCK